MLQHDRDRLDWRGPGARGARDAVDGAADEQSGERQPGNALARAQAQARAEDAREAAAAPDPDERAAGPVARGYLPGQISQLSGRLAETEAALADEEAKIERGSTAILPRARSAWPSCCACRTPTRVTRRWSRSCSAGLTGCGGRWGTLWRWPRRSGRPRRTLSDAREITRTVDGAVIR